MIHSKLYLAVFSILLVTMSTKSYGQTLINDVDRLVYKKYPHQMHYLAKPGIPKDDKGLLGRNHKWGGVYSPRFQVGAGKALRIAIASGEVLKANKALRAIEVGLNNIKSNGYIPSSLPLHISQGKKLSAGDKASAVSFFLADACSGLLASLNTSLDTNRTIEGLRMATQWLLSQQEILEHYDQEAPNRLLINALAFHSCGQLAEIKEAIEVSEIFVKKAIESMRDEGFFLEKDGWDTSYQAVSIRVAIDLLLSGYSKEVILPVLERSSNWMLNRIDCNGRVDSTGNTRTCSGGEEFIGSSKKLAIGDVLSFLVYMDILLKNNIEITRAAKNVSLWIARHGTNVDPCWEQE